MSYLRREVFLPLLSELALKGDHVCKFTLVCKPMAIGAENTKIFVSMPVDSKNVMKIQ